MGGAKWLLPAGADWAIGERPSGERDFLPPLISRSARADGLKYPHFGQTYSASVA